jgi:hypothetical protein
MLLFFKELKYRNETILKNKYIEIISFLNLKIMKEKRNKLQKIFISFRISD